MPGGLLSAGSGSGTPRVVIDVGPGLHTAEQGALALSGQCTTWENAPE